MRQVDILSHLAKGWEKNVRESLSQDLDGIITPVTSWVLRDSAVIPGSFPLTAFSQ